MPEPSGKVAYTLPQLATAAGAAGAVGAAHGATREKPAAGAIGSGAGAYLGTAAGAIGGSMLFGHAHPALGGPLVIASALGGGALGARGLGRMLGGKRKKEAALKIPLKLSKHVQEALLDEAVPGVGAVLGAAAAAHQDKNPSAGAALGGGLGSLPGLLRKVGSTGPQKLLGGALLGGALGAAGGYALDGVRGAAVGGGLGVLGGGGLGVGVQALKELKTPQGVRGLYAQNLGNVGNDHIIRADGLGRATSNLGDDPARAVAASALMKSYGHIAGHDGRGDRVVRSGKDVAFRIAHPDARDNAGRGAPFVGVSDKHETTKAMLRLLDAESPGHQASAAPGLSKVRELQDEASKHWFRRDTSKTAEESKGKRILEGTLGEGVPALGGVIGAGLAARFGKSPVAGSALGASLGAVPLLLRRKEAFATSQYSGPLTEGRFKMRSAQGMPAAPQGMAAPAKTASLWKSAAVAIAAVAAHEQKIATISSPKQQLASSQNTFQGPRVAAPTGPSIASTAKPKGFGTPLPGTTKTALLKELVRVGLRDVPGTPRLLMKQRNIAERTAVGNRVGELYDKAVTNPLMSVADKVLSKVPGGQNPRVQSAARMIAKDPVGQTLMQAVPVPGAFLAYEGAKRGLTKTLNRLDPPTVA